LSITTPVPSLSDVLNHAEYLPFLSIDHASQPRLSLDCQPPVHLGGNAQTSRFSERSTSLFSERHLAGFRNNFRRPVIPNPAIRRMLTGLLHDQPRRRGVKDMPNALFSTITS
jgi:hypothetical protein